MTTRGESNVEMELVGLENGLTKIVLTGRLDTPAIDRIEARFVASIVAASRSAIVDLSRVNFVASMGIRMFITVARSLALRHAKLALYGPQTMVNEVFESISLKEIIPIVDSEADAIVAVES
jgi:anti-sigma B factor antagonist